jgi:hypothetical protein
MKLFLTLIFTILISSVLRSQTSPPISWEHTIGFSYDDELIVAKEWRNNSYLYFGTRGNNLGVYSIRYSKANSNGQVVWSKSYSGGGGDIAVCADSTLDGGLVIGLRGQGNAFGDQNLDVLGATDYYVLKTDSLGNIEGQFRFGGTDNDRLGSIVVLEDGGYLLSGWSNSLASGNKSQSSIGGNQIWLVRLDLNFDIVWDKVINLSSQIADTKTKLCPDGGFVIGGYVGLDLRVVKVDNSGELVWVKNMGGSDAEHFLDIEVSENGNILVLAESASDISDTRTVANNALFYDLWFIQLDSLGNENWQLGYSGTSIPSNWNFVGGGIDKVNDGYVVSSARHFGVNGKFTLVTMRIDVNGNILWEKEWPGPNSGDSFAHDVQYTSSGKILISSYSDADAYTSNTIGWSGMPVKADDSYGGFDWWPILLNNDCGLPTPTVSSLPEIIESCSFLGLNPPTASSGCGAMITGTTDAIFPISSNSTIQWEFSDEYGNTISQSQSIVINDLTPPVANIASLPNVNSECAITSLESPSATDNCSGIISGTHDVTLPLTAQGTTTVTWTYDDGNGNIATQTQEVIINDASAPTVDVATLAAITAECSINPTSPTATDNCAGSITGTPNIAFPITASGIITWTFDDGNGNSSTQTQEVIINDFSTPTPDIANLAVINSECSFSPTAPTATDNCAGSISGTPDITFPITEDGIIIWTYDDGNGNTTTQTQEVIINDVSAPTADLAALPNVTAECSVSNLTAPTATDNCAGSITGITDISFPITENGIITWTYDDGNGNSSTQTQEVVINDISAPVANAAILPIINSECSFSPIAPTATDNCAGSITGTTNITLPITQNGITSIVWTYDDGNGNTSSQTQVVNLAPIDSSITQINAFTLNAEASGYSYQWLDCDNDNQPISGETNQTFNATNIGNYAVEISNGNCSVMSECISVLTVGIDDNHIPNVSVYPNPTNGLITIDSKLGLDRIQLINSIGQTIFETSNIADKNFTIELPEPAGIYLLNVQSDGMTTTSKIIKK